ncbi:hypothetical protein LSCM1_07064 [Leishmania martiniquensis]|uniref:Uncharacterized protein n=1 Tax=Leishmania martiniquensis TaxID=1580590 RepID=A0A836KW30_9TRYP|nr:hypothetical protein LSCM1_07064 [Leishmania martiniquensis]
MATVAMESSSSAPPPQFEVVCTGCTRTLLPTPHSGSCPLDYTALFVTLYRQQSEKIARLHASHPVPLLAPDSPRAKQVHATSPPNAAGWTTTRTPLPSAAAAADTSLNTVLDGRGHDAERFGASSDLSAAPPARSSEEGLAVVERPVPESVAAAMARVTAAPSSPVGTVDHHQRPPRPNPQHMQYRVGRSGSTQLISLPGPHAGPPSDDYGDTLVAHTPHTEDAAPRPTARRVLSASLHPPADLPPSPTDASSASTSVPRASVSLVSLAASSIRPSPTLPIATAAVEITALPSSTDRRHSLVCHDSPHLADRGDTPGETSMTEVQQSGRPPSWHRRQRMSGGQDVSGVAVVGPAGAHDEADAQERLQQQLPRALARQREVERLMFGADGGGEGDTRRPHQHTEEPLPLASDASDAHHPASVGPRGGRAPGAAAPYPFHRASTDDGTEGIRADSVVAARGLPLACTPACSRASTSPSPQPQDNSSRWRRGASAHRRRPQPGAAQRGPRDHQQLSPSPAAAAEEDAHSRYTAFASQLTSRTSYSAPASSDAVSRSAAPPAVSASERTAHMPSSPSIRADRDEPSASLHASSAFATAGVVDVDGTMARPSSSISVNLSCRPSLPLRALTDDSLSSRPLSEEVCGAESTRCQGSRSRTVSACASFQRRVSCTNSPAAHGRDAAAVTAAVDGGTDGYRARKPESRDDFDDERCTQEAYWDGVLEENAGAFDMDTPVVRRTSPGTSGGTGDKSRSRRSSSTPGAAASRDQISARAALVGGGGDDLARGRRSCQDSWPPPFSCTASMSSSSSLSLAPRHARTDTKAGGIDMDAAFEEVAEAGSSVHVQALTATTSPTVFLSDMLCLSFSPDHASDGSATFGNDVGEAFQESDNAHVVEAQKTRLGGETHVDAVRCRYTSGVGGHRCPAPSFLGDDGDNSLPSNSTASTSSSPPSQNHTAMRRVTGMEAAAAVSDSSLSALTLSPLVVSHGRCRTTASVARAAPSACTPHRVTGRLALSADERRLHASTASTVAWGSATSGDHRNAAAAVATTTSHTSASSSAAAAATACLPATPAESSSRSSLLSIFSTPAQTRLQSLLQASTWFTATPCSRATKNRSCKSNSSSSGEGHEYLPIAHQRETGSDDKHVRGSGGSGSSSMTPTRLSLAYTFPAAAQASAGVDMTASKATASEAASAATPGGAGGDNAAPSTGDGGANWLSRAREREMQLFDRVTRHTHARGGSRAKAPKTYSLACSPKQPPSSSPSSPLRYSTGSLSFFLAAAATSPGSEGGTRASGGFGLSGDDEGRRMRAGSSGVYGSAVAQRRSWAPRKQQQDRQRRRQSYSSMGIHTPSVSSQRLSRTYSSGSGLSEALAVAPQRLTFGSAIASVAGPNSNISSAECWQTASSTPVALALSHPGQQRQYRAPPPPYAASPDDAFRRGDLGEETVKSSRRSLLLPSNPRAASPRQSWAQPTSSPLLLSPLAPRTPSGRPSLSSTEFTQAPLRHGETRDGFSSCSLPSTSVAGAAAQRPLRLHGSSRRSPSLGSGSFGGGCHDVGGRHYTSRALSFSVLRSPSSALATTPVWAGLEHAAVVSTPLDGRIDAVSPSPLNSSRRRRTSGSGRSRTSALLVLQPQSAQSRASATAPQPTLADELRLFASPAFPAALSQPLASASSTSPPLMTTFIASPPRRTGPSASTSAPPHSSSLAHSHHQRPSLPPELLALLQMRSSASSTTAAAKVSRHDPEEASASPDAAETASMAPPCASPSPGKSVQRRGCSERCEVNVEQRQQGPSTPHRSGPLPPQ